MGERYPGYDVLAKRGTPSWNDKTRDVIDARLAMSREPRYLTPTEWRTLAALCDRILPQPPDRPPVPLAAFVDEKLLGDRRDGFRPAALPPLREAWRIGLAALDAAAADAHGRRFDELPAPDRDALIKQMEMGMLDGPAWRGMPSAVFFDKRVLPDITESYYSHPTAWNEIGFGGPASPRGYVRLGFDRRDPWEAVEARSGHEHETREENRRVR
jgi:hypothetical protein